jgi:hypothetical protein
MDPDNLVGGVKPLLDGMVKAKIIPDDNPDQIRLYVSQVKGDSNAVRVTVVGTPVADPRYHLCVVYSKRSWSYCDDSFIGRRLVCRDAKGL